MIRSPNSSLPLELSTAKELAASIARLQTAGSGGVRAGLCRVAGCAKSASFAGHAGPPRGDRSLHPGAGFILKR